MSSRLKTGISMQVTEARWGKEEERQSTVFTAAIPHFLCLTTTLMTPFAHSQFITLTARHTAFIHKAMMTLSCVILIKTKLIIQ